MEKRIGRRHEVTISREKTVKKKEQKFGRSKKTIPFQKEAINSMICVESILEMDENDRFT